MTKSMTAYANSETTVGNFTLHCELRSINHRYSDISVKLPERLRFIEADLRSAIAEKASRGKIECSITYKQQAQERAWTVNDEAVAAVLAAAARIEQHMHSSRTFSALEILAFPGVQQELETDKGIIARELQALLQDTLASFVGTREREGKQLASLIEERCFKMQGFVAAASHRMPEVLQLMRNKLRDKVSELIAQPDYDRLEQELVLLAQKLDVSEELDRLETHVNEVLRVLKQEEPVGRRLDFLMQELNREANTLGSKSADREMTQIAIELKVLIEQMREQIQNLE